MQNTLICVQFSSVAQLCLTLCDPMNRSTPGLPVHHQVLEFTQTHVHPVSDAIQPAHPLPSPSPPALNFPSIRVFSNESALCIRWPKYWSFSFNISTSNEQSGLISFTILQDLLYPLKYTLSLCPFCLCPCEAGGPMLIFIMSFLLHEATSSLS